MDCIYRSYVTPWFVKGACPMRLRVYASIRDFAGKTRN